jgi:tripartite ATP-independent transporter DctP family solute receptor
MKIGKLAMAIVLVLFICGAAAADGPAPIKLGVVTRPGAAQSVAANQFKKLIETRSSMRVTVYDSGFLGTEAEMLKKIQRGTIQMGIITSGPFDEFLPEARVIDYPYLFESYEQVDRVLGGPLGAELLTRLEKAGFKGLAFSENGFRHVTNSKRPIGGVDDVKGLRIRVMESYLHEALWRLFGAEPIPMGSLDAVAKELAAGLIDGQENPLSAIWSNNFYVGQKYLSLTGHVYSAHIAVANVKWFKDLPPGDRKLVEGCMNQAARYERNWSRASEAGFLDKLKATGLIVNAKPDVASFRARAAGAAELDVFKAPEVRELLGRFQEAAKAGGR